MTISYAVENDLCAVDFLAVLDGSGLAERRPVDDPGRIAKMLKHADLIVTVRDGAGAIVGVARSVTDFSFCCYLSDLAVDRAFQRRGIGAQLIKRTRAEVGQETTLVLLSAPQAMTYYPRIGLDVFDNCFGLKRPWTED